MSRLQKALRRRQIARRHRAIERAIATAPSQSMRDELIVVAQRDTVQRLR